jgi:hypothetical protein
VPSLDGGAGGERADARLVGRDGLGQAADRRPELAEHSRHALGELLHLLLVALARLTLELRDLGLERVRGPGRLTRPVVSTRDHDGDDGEGDKQYSDGQRPEPE